MTKSFVCIFKWSPENQEEIYSILLADEAPASGMIQGFATVGDGLAYLLSSNLIILNPSIVALDLLEIEALISEKTILQVIGPNGVSAETIPLNAAAGMFWQHGSKLRWIEDYAS
jgi:hypothetical protein